MRWTEPPAPGWPAPLDAAWAAFAVANLAAIWLLPGWETVPFHFIWVSITLLYGYRIWRIGPTLATLGAVIASTAALIWVDVLRGYQPIDEITEVPLMSAMFLAMVWHAQRRQAAMREVERVSADNLRLLEQGRRFIQDASHELRTPITVALGHAELMGRTAIDPVIASDARVVVDELGRLRRLADRLLLLAGAENPDFLHPERLEAGGLIADARRRWGPTDRRLSLGRIDPAPIDGDADRLSLALDALIENAVHHTGPGDEIVLSATRRDGSVAIGVADTGPGIPPEETSRIFDRFARTAEARRRDRDGMGLGLPIVRSIAGAHRGSVRLETSPGNGSLFEIVLPLAEPAPNGRSALHASNSDAPGR